MNEHNKLKAMVLLSDGRFSVLDFGPGCFFNDCIDFESPDMKRIVTIKGVVDEKATIENMKRVTKELVALSDMVKELYHDSDTLRYDG